MTTQEVLADFIVGTSLADIDPIVWERSQAGIADTVGVAFAGSREPLAKAMLGYLRDCGELGDQFESILFASSEHASASNAALYNGTIAHALDYDDYDFPASGHFSAGLVSALMSVTQDKELFSDDFRCAYIVGYEVGGKLGRPLPRSKRGPVWHSTGVLGPVACAAAVSKLLGLDRATTINALGIASSCGAGIRANFGSMTKPLHSGRAAQAGVTAALMARNGFDSSADTFDGKTGFFRGFGTAEPTQIANDVHESLSALGDPWEMQTETGFYLKPYPSCAGTHAAIEATLRIAAKIDYTHIASIYVGQSLVTPLVLTYHRPEGELQAKFSMEYCVAAALRWKTVAIDTFTDARIHEADVQALMDKMTVEVDDRVRDSKEHAAVVKVVLDSGETFEELVEAPKGQGSRFMTADEQRIKFVDCANGVLAASDAASLFDSVLNPSLADWSSIASLLSGKGSAS